MKIDKTIIKETGYIFYFSLVLSVLMQAVFLVIGKWDYTVLLGNLLALFSGVSNFFLMGLGVQKAVGKEEKDAQTLMRFSQMGRLFYQFLLLLVGVLAPCFNTIAAVVPLFFPRIAVAARPYFGRKKAGKEGEDTK